MANPVWGQLQRALDDPETIQDAIDAAIAVHETDPTAHLGDGESLQTHKNDEVIDHPAGSVVEDKYALSSVGATALLLNKYEVKTTFESSDKWSATGDTGYTFNANFGCLALRTGNVTNRYASAEATDDTSGINFADKNPVFEFIAYWQHATNCTYRAETGDYGVDSIGFEQINGAMYGIVTIGSTKYSTAIIGDYTNAYNVFTARCISGVKVEFYINNVLVAEDSTHIPTNNSTSTFFYLYIKTGENYYKYFYAQLMRFYQDL